SSTTSSVGAVTGVGAVSRRPADSRALPLRLISSIRRCCPAWASLLMLPSATPCAAMVWADGRAVGAGAAPDCALLSGRRTAQEERLMASPRSARCVVPLTRIIPYLLKFVSVHAEHCGHHGDGNAADGNPQKQNQRRLQGG